MQIKLAFKTTVLALILTLTMGSLVLLAYRYYGYGTPISRIPSPDGAYYLQVYASFNLLAIQRNLFTMPGDSSCDPVWVRLYDQSDTQLNALYTNDCQIAEGWITWRDNRVGLPDGHTSWTLPTPVTSGMQRY